jgi:hypothetical protein
MAKQGRKAKRGAPQAPAEPAPQAAALAEAAPQPSRTTSNAFIALFLLFQLAMPLRYYLGGRGDDERFSWRMFSTVRMHKCEIAVHELQAGELRKVDLTQAVQIAWIALLERNRTEAVHALLRRRCGRHEVSEVHFDRQCTSTDGSALPPLALRMDCKSGRVSTTEAKP